MIGVVRALRFAISEWFVRLGWGFVVTEDEATELGFMPDDVSQAKRMIEAMAAPADTLLVAMDAARFYNDPLADATKMVIGARLGKTRDLRRSGFESFRDLRNGVKGMAKRYATTLNGQGEVRAARREAADKMHDILR